MVVVRLLCGIRLMDFQHNQSCNCIVAHDGQHGTQHLVRKHRDKDLYIYYSNKQNGWGSRCLRHILDDIHCMDRQNNLANIYMLQLRFFLCKPHLHHTDLRHKDVESRLLVEWLLKILRKIFVFFSFFAKKAWTGQKRLNHQSIQQF